MTQKAGWLYSLLGNSAIYSSVGAILAKQDSRRVLADSYIQPRKGDKIIDIGCGPASMLPYLGEVEYLGFDPEADYIRLAQEKYGGRGQFIQASMTEMVGKFDESADVVLAIAVLHHLADQEAATLFRVARDLLKPGGRLITFDCAITTPQNPVARLLINLDRGQCVRRPEGYLALARTAFDDVASDLRLDLMRVPYTHFIMTCTAR